MVDEIVDCGSECSRGQVLDLEVQSTSLESAPPMQQLNADFAPCDLSDMRCKASEGEVSVWLSSLVM